jgi:hypothetical protein
VAINFTNKYLQVPMQNGVPVTVPTLLPTVANQPRNDQNGFARADLNLGRHTLDARFYVTNVNDLTQNSISATSQGEANYNLDYNSAGIYFGNLGDTWILKSNLLNIFRVGYKRYSYTIAPKDPTTFQALGAANLIQYGRQTRLTPTMSTQISRLTTPSHGRVATTTSRLERSTWTFSTSIATTSRPI